MKPYWLIESNGGAWCKPSHPLWLRVIVENDGSHLKSRIDWTEDATVALAFHREQDARAFVFLFPEHCVLASVTEHLTMENGS